MSWAVGCCRCMRIMNPKGKPVGEPVLHGGLMDLSAMMTHFSTLKQQSADFPSKEAADAAAKGFGWIVVDGNHRCPGCFLLEQAYKDNAVERRGCYIDWDLQRQIDGPDSTPEAT